nr:hypothetical protein [Candidatus Sigynarchaeum springense]
MSRTVSGRYSARVSWIYASLVHAILAAFLIWSLSFYPGEYSMFSNAVSNLGDPLLNPWPGWAVFSAGISTFGSLMVPHVLYLYRKLTAMDRKWGRRFLVTSVIGNAGNVGVGMFSEASATLVPHVIAAALVFWGLFSAAACSWPPLIALVRRLPSGRRYRCSVAVLASMLLVTVVSFSTAMLSGFLTLLRGYSIPGLLSMEFWEWMLVVSLDVHTFLLTAMVNHLAPD